jgi:hypothetical protein
VSGSIHFICMDWRHAEALLSAARAAYSELKNMCVWVKDRAGMGSLYRSQHELVFVFKSGTGAHRNNVELGRHGRDRTNVWHYPSIHTLREGEEGDLLACIRPASRSRWWPMRCSIVPSATMWCSMPSWAAARL